MKKLINDLEISKINKLVNRTTVLIVHAFDLKIYLMVTK